MSKPALIPGISGQDGAYLAKLLLDHGYRVVGAHRRNSTMAIGRLEEQGHFGPFAVVLDQNLFLVAQTPSAALVLAQDRILPFLGGGPLLRSSTLNFAPGVANGVVVALGGEPVELVIATDVCVQFLQVTAEPNFVFRVCEKMALRIKEPEAIIPLTA